MVTEIAGSAVVNSLLRVSRGITPLLLGVNVRYLKYPSSRVRAVRRTTVIRKLSPSSLIIRVGAFVSRSLNWFAGEQLTCTNHLLFTVGVLLGYYRHLSNDFFGGRVAVLLRGYFVNERVILLVYML